MTLFSPFGISVFVVLNRKLQAQPVDAFNTIDFGSTQPFNGIEVCDATQENFEHVVGSEKACVLFGWVCAVKHLKDPVVIPKSKGKKE